MAVPEYVLGLRRLVGAEHLLWLPGITAVVTRPGAGGGVEVVVIRRSDTGAWTPVTGLIDPLEEPADAAVREVREETGLTVVPRRLTGTTTGGPVRHENGDVSAYLELTFLCEYVSGELRRSDGDEVVDAKWVAADDLPPMSPTLVARIRGALSGEPAAAFRVTEPPAS